MTNKRLVWYLKKKKKIDVIQFSFRKQTQYAISKIFDNIGREQKTPAIFFDIEKAYDKVNRDKALEQQENMGIQGRMLRFIRELISER